MATLQVRLFPDDPSAEGFYHCVLQSYLPDRGQVLDLGCGDHAELNRYRTADRAVWGTDLQRHPHLQNADWFRLIEEDGCLPFDDGSFDLVVSRWVLEHVQTPITFLHEVCRVLRPGGAFVSLSINGLHYVTGLSRLAGFLPHRMTQKLIQWLYKRPCHDTFPTCYRLNNHRQLQQSATATGLELTMLRHLVSPDYFAFFTPLRHMACLTDWSLEKLHPGWGRLYFVAALTKPGTGVVCQVA